MMNRKRFIRTVGAGVLAPAALLAQERTSRRPSLWDFLFRDQPVAPAPMKPDPSRWSDSTITAAWIGHSTVLINFFGTRIITDPVFSEKAGLYFPGLFTIGTKRLVAPAMTIEELPPIDCIISSHAHFDHLDLPSLRKFGKDIPIVMAKNTADLISFQRHSTVRELDWGESIEIAGLRIEAFRVRHFGWRYPWERDRSKGNADGRSYNAYLISKNGRYVFFGGDTALCDYFNPIGERGCLIDLAILPIGAYDPWIRVHASPEQALAMAAGINARYLLPVHWSTFRLSSEPVTEPIERLKRAISQHSPRLALESIGETWTLPAL